MFDSKIKELEAQLSELRDLANYQAVCDVNDDVQAKTQERIEAVRAEIKTLRS